MLALQKRLQRLEARLTDGSGRRPHSPEWLAYWDQKLTRILTGEEPGEPGCIPLEVWDAFSEEPDAGSKPPELVQLATVGAGVSEEMASDNA